MAATLSRKRANRTENWKPNCFGTEPTELRKLKLPSPDQLALELQEVESARTGTRFRARAYPTEPGLTPIGPRLTRSNLGLPDLTWAYSIFLASKTSPKPWTSMKKQRIKQKNDPQDHRPSPRAGPIGPGLGSHFPSKCRSTTTPVNKKSLPEFIRGFGGFPGHGPNQAGPALGFTRARGKDDGGLHKLLK